MDYILTVAVSMSSGVAQIVSAFPALMPFRVAIAVALVGLVMLINLRGVRESGSVVAVPTFFFIGIMYLTVGTALVKHFAGTLGAVVDPPPMHAAHHVAPISLFLLLHAFSSGTTALTGVEAISNGIPAFKEPRSRNAGITLAVDVRDPRHAVPGDQLPGGADRRGAVGGRDRDLADRAHGLRRQGSALPGRRSRRTALILVMAANTAYAGFPRLAALQAEDGFLPRQLTYRGSRLVYSRGIVVLALVASALIWMFDASVTGLIPLYAIGVFLSFTLSQAGMARRWWKSGQPGPGGGAARAGLDAAPRPRAGC